MKFDNKIAITSIFTAIAASICCITPILAIIGTSAFASTFSWLEPLRPYLIGLTILVLIFSWFQKLKPQKKIECNCETYKKNKFIQTKSFLGIVTIIAILMLSFPYYSSIFYTKNENKSIDVNKANFLKINFTISGMTCNSCAVHINQEINKLSGIIFSNVSYKDKNAYIEFDKSKTNMEEIEKTINSTGYIVTNKRN